MDHDFKNPKSTRLPPAPRPARRQADVDPAREEYPSADVNECDVMFGRLQGIILDGLKHGFFDLRITCELVKDRKRRVVIKAGKCHQFTIREEDLQR
jgi:hypothetical protein